MIGKLIIQLAVCWKEIFNMCQVRWEYCYCCWSVMTKITLSRCYRWYLVPSACYRPRPVCQVEKIWPVECWWKKCNQCTENCPLFEECHSNLPMFMSVFYVSPGTDNPKFDTLSGIQHSNRLRAGAKWKWNWKKLKFVYVWNDNGFVNHSLVYK